MLSVSKSAESAALLVITTQSASITFQNTLISKPYVNVSVNALHQLDLNGMLQKLQQKPPLTLATKKRISQKNRILPQAAIPTTQMIRRAILQ